MKAGASLNIPDNAGQRLHYYTRDGPKGRQLQAAIDEGIIYICIQLDLLELLRYMNIYYRCSSYNINLN